MDELRKAADELSPHNRVAFEAYFGPPPEVSDELSAWTRSVIGRVLAEHAADQNDRTFEAVKALMTVLLRSGRP